MQFGRCANRRQRLEIFINFIIVGYSTENWIRYWLKVKLQCDRPVSEGEKLLLCELEMGDV